MFISQRPLLSVQRVNNYYDCGGTAVGSTVVDGKLAWMDSLDRTADGGGGINKLANPLAIAEPNIFMVNAISDGV